MNENQSGESKYPFLDMMKQMHESKDMDAISDMIWNIITMYGLTMAEVAALNYYVMERTLKSPVNERIIKEDMKIDIDAPTVHDGYCVGPGTITKTQKVFDIQRALLSKYVNDLND